MRRICNFAAVEYMFADETESYLILLMQRERKMSKLHVRCTKDFAFACVREIVGDTATTTKSNANSEYFSDFYSISFQYLSRPKFVCRSHFAAAELQTKSTVNNSNTRYLNGTMQHSVEYVAFFSAHTHKHKHNAKWYRLQNAAYKIVWKACENLNYEKITFFSPQRLLVEIVFECLA